MLSLRKKQKSRQPFGFSLVELLVVMLLMGLVAALSFPRIQTTLLAYEREAMEDRLHIFLRQQMSESNLTGKRFSIEKGRFFELLDSEQSASISLKLLDSSDIAFSELVYHAMEAVNINENGVCHDTKIALVLNSARRELKLNAPFCLKI